MRYFVFSALLISPKFPRTKETLSVRCIHGDHEACSQLTLEASKPSLSEFIK